jgi:Uma2 family endonuclease
LRAGYIDRGLVRNSGPYMLRVRLPWWHALEVMGGEMMSIAERTIPALRAGQRMSVKEFLRRWEAMPELKFAELIDGVVYMPSPVTTDHGRNDAWVVIWLGNYCAYTPGCEVGSQATWLMLRSAPQPDAFLWVRPEKGGQSRVVGKYHVGAPELAAEVCLTSAAYDLGVKKGLYQAAGVREYVAVVVEQKQVLWHRLVRGKYKLCRPNSRGIFESEQFPGLCLDSRALWKEDWPRLLRTLDRGLESAAHAAFVKELAGRKK